MKPTNDLFNLIKSLSSNEKRYFKLFAVSVGGRENSAYMRLFNAIDAMNTYDEELLRSKFKNEAFVKQLSVAKNYLYHVILKSLVQSNAENTFQIRLAMQVAQAEILLEKGLHDQCFKFINLVKKELKRVEDFHLLDKLIDIEGRILLKKFAFTQISKNNEEQNKLFKKKLYANEMKRKAIEIYEFNQQMGGTASEENKHTLKAMIQPLLDNPPADDSGTAAKFYYLTCINFYHGALKDANMRLAYAQKVMELLRANPDFVEMNPRLYFSATNNLCQALLGISDFKRVEQLLQEVRKKNVEAGAGIKKEIQMEAMAGVLNTEILLYINNKQYERAAAIEAIVIEELGKDMGKLGNFYLLELSFNLAHAKFLNRDYQRALDYLENVLRDSNHEQRRDLHYASRVFQIILHYELGTKKLLQNISDTTMRYLKRQNMLTQFDTTLIQYLRNSANANKATLQELLEVLKANDFPKTSLLVGYIDVVEWLERKLNA